ncbi:hypothetical protein AB0395_30115 [Streptosporangium sp. NPDC051023]|uniref:hypothetical protein n=1 Tax=Streptosporangium sp. NPDC051023 TaxID=3155410 RepID=UPI00344DA417
MAGDPNDVIESGGQTGPRRWVGIAVLAVLVAVPVISLLAGRDPGAPASPAQASTPGVVSAPVAAGTPTNVLYPRPRSKGDRETLDVVFPDGSKAQIGYPAELGLAKLGVRPAQGGWLEGYFSLFRMLTVPPGGYAEIAQGRPMLRRLAGHGTLWQPTGPTEGQVMMFDFAPWYVTLRDQKDGMTYEQRLLWAENLRGRVTGDGYLVLEATSPVRLAGPGQLFRGALVGPQLWFGGAGEAVLVIAPAPRCDIREISQVVPDPSGGFSSRRCADGVYIEAAGERAAVERMIAGVRVRLTS